MIKKYTLGIGSYVKGILIILLSKLIASFVSFNYTMYQITRLSIDEFKNVHNLSATILIQYITQLISAAGLLLAGYFIVKKLKSRMLLRTIILAVIWIVITFLISFVDVYSGRVKLNNFVQTFSISSIKTILFITIGGFIARYKNK